MKRQLEQLLAVPIEAGGDETDTPPNVTLDGSTSAFSGSLDAYKYVGFEQEFRGTKTDIARRLKGYCSRFENTSDVLDVGCGRGEFLSVLREQGLSGRGIDANHEMVSVCRDQELDVIEADALEYLTSLPDGYNTMVGERGVGLSGGQRQRLSIARTLLVDPSILILDDSTSSVDAQTEHLLQMTLAEAIENRTTFIITNRLSTIKSAELILVFKNGEIVERGNEAQLLDLNGEYRELYEYQIRPHEEALKQMNVNSLTEAGL